MEQVETSRLAYRVELAFATLVFQVSALSATDWASGFGLRDLESKDVS